MWQKIIYSTYNQRINELSHDPADYNKSFTISIAEGLYEDMLLTGNLSSGLSTQKKEFNELPGNEKSFW